MGAMTALWSGPSPASFCDFDRRSLTTRCDRNPDESRRVWAFPHSGGGRFRGTALRASPSADEVACLGAGRVAEAVAAAGEAVEVARRQVRQWSPEGLVHLPRVVSASAASLCGHHRPWSAKPLGNGWGDPDPSIGTCQTPRIFCLWLSFHHRLVASPPGVVFVDAPAIHTNEVREEGF